MNSGIPQLHIFAGPNGSGKSTLIREIRHARNIGYYINADDIEKNLLENKHLNLAYYGLWPKNEYWINFLQTSSLARGSTDNTTNLELKDNVIVAQAGLSPYDAALLAEFLRWELQRERANFAFETVMSHPSKLEFLQHAKQEGYSCHLHFISTESPLINKERVKSRVLKGGHGVDSGKIEQRWYRSLELLHQMIPFTDNCYLYDNSGVEMRLFVHIVNGTTIVRLDKNLLPQWYKQYVTAKGIRNMRKKRIKSS